MSISLRHPRLSLEDMFDLSMARARREIMHPPIIAPRELYRKIRRAAKAIGIEDAVIYRWDRDLLSSWFTDGCVREKQYLQSDMRHDRHKDIGYVVKDRQNGKYTIRSFEINAFVFSDKAYQHFQKALEKEELKSGAHSPFGTIFYTKREIKAWEYRTPLYR